MPAVRILLAWSCLAATARAELPPQAYESMRAGAAEVLDVTVLETASRRTSGWFLSRRGEWAETATLRVDAVVRSRSGAAVGDRVEIAYTRHVSGAVGPSPLPRLARGQKIRVWLNRNGERFRPAARARSFEALP